MTNDTDLVVEYTDDGLICVIDPREIINLNGSADV